MILFGCLPFRTHDGRIVGRIEDYMPIRFPEDSDKYVSSSAIKLISSMLSLNPNERPSIQEVMESEWFQIHYIMDATTRGTSPASISAYNESILYEF